MELQSCYIFSSNYFFRFVRRRRRQTRNCCVACGNVRVSQHPSYAMCSTGSLIATATSSRAELGVVADNADFSSLLYCR